MLTKYRQLLLYWFPIIIYCLAIYFQSSNPSPEQVPDIPYLDKGIHFCAYAILGALFLRALRTLPVMKNQRVVLFLSILFAAMYGVSDEIHQYFVPYRDADIMDVLADTIGSVAGVFAYHKLIDRGRPGLIKFLN